MGGIVSCDRALLKKPVPLFQRMCSTKQKDAEIVLFETRVTTKNVSR